MKCRGLLILAVGIALVGCTRVVVQKDPGPRDKGIRYYRPKPYLLIVPDSSAASSKPTFSASINQNKPIEVVTPAGYSQHVQPNTVERLPPPVPETRKVSISLQYLPDFAEEYSIRLMPGLGIGELNVKLDNGWNLTSVGMKTDQQTDEIIKATADLVAAPPGPKGMDFTDPRGAIYAVNIPFGFYEAVIATDPHGRKQLYGWRYVGFMPFQACPVQPCGMNMIDCHDPTGIYGMVINNDGVMRFERLGDLPCMSEPGSQKHLMTPTN